MERQEIQLLASLRAFLREEPSPVLLQNPEEWAALWKLAAEQKVLPMTADALSHRPELPTAIRQEALLAMAAQVRAAAALSQCYAALEQTGASPLVVKGLLCRRLYPKPDLRLSADEDLLVQPGQASGIVELLRQQGFAVDGSDAEQVITCCEPVSGLRLEIHRTLFSPDSRAYGSWNQLFDGVFERKHYEEQSGVWTLCHQDHLLYLILHSLKHFLHSGFGIRQVCDICLFTAAYGGEIDWQLLDRQLSRTRSRIFYANLLSIGREHLGIEPYPAAAGEWLGGIPTDCEELLRDLLAGGVYGGNSEQRRHSSLITLHAAAGESSAWKGLLRTVFPGQRELAGAYTWLKRRPYLLPAAWAARIFRYVRSNRDADARESVAVGRYRVQLLKKYGVIPENSRESGDGRQPHDKECRNF